MYFADDTMFEESIMNEDEKIHDKFERRWNIFIIRVIQSCGGSTSAGDLYVDENVKRRVK